MAEHANPAATAAEKCVMRFIVCLLAGIQEVISILLPPVPIPQGPSSLRKFSGNVEYLILYRLSSYKNRPHRTGRGAGVRRPADSLPSPSPMHQTSREVGINHRHESAAAEFFLQSWGKFRRSQLTFRISRGNMSCSYFSYENYGKEACTC